MFLVFHRCGGKQTDRHTHSFTSCVTSYRSLQNYFKENISFLNRNISGSVVISIRASEAENYVLHNGTEKILWDHLSLDSRDIRHDISNSYNEKLRLFDRNWQRNLRKVYGNLKVYSCDSGLKTNEGRMIFYHFLLKSGCEDNSQLSGYAPWWPIDLLN